jgi:hypothetical protein
LFSDALHNDSLFSQVILGKEVAEFEPRTVSHYRTDPTANFLGRRLTAERTSALSREKQRARH